MVTIRKVEGKGSDKPNLPEIEIKTVSSSGRKYQHATDDKNVKQNIDPLQGSIPLEKKELKEKKIKNASPKNNKKALTNIFHSKKSEKKTKNYPPLAGAPGLHSNTKEDHKENKNEPKGPHP